MYDRILHKTDISVSVGTNCCDDDWCLDTAKVVADFHVGNFLVVVDNNEQYYVECCWL